MKKPNRVIEPGQRHFNLVTIRRVKVTSKDYRWLCKCDCGNETLIRTCNLGRETKGCGCLWKQQRNLPNHQAAVNRLIRGYKRHAAHRGYSWSLNEAQFREITSGSCYYCGAAPSQIAKNNHNNAHGYVYNGVDRLDNDSGYEPGNCVSCCGKCNRMKMDHSLAEFLTHIRQILKFTETLPVRHPTSINNNPFRRSACLPPR